MWSLTGGNVLYLHHILDEEIKADRGGGWQAARCNAAGDAVSPVAMPRAGSSSAMNRYPNAGSSWWIIRSCRIDCVSRYLWAKLSWVPDSSTFDGICLMSANYKVTVQDEGFVEVMYFGKPSLTTLYPSWRIHKIEV